MTKYVNHCLGHRIDGWGRGVTEAAIEAVVKVFSIHVVFRAYRNYLGYGFHLVPGFAFRQGHAFTRHLQDNPLIRYFMDMEDALAAEYGYRQRLKCPVSGFKPQRFVVLP